MKFKLFGIVWDLTFLFYLLFVSHILFGMLLLLLVFAIPQMEWELLPFIIIAFSYMATFTSISNKLDKTDKVESIINLKEK